MANLPLIFSFVEYLETLKSNEAYSSEQINQAIASLGTVFGISYDVANFQQYSIFPAELPDVFEAGRSSLNAQTHSKAVETAESNPKFESFFEAVASKGYFEGTEEGSIEYLQRKAKLVSRFHEKVSANAPPSRAELEKQAEELKMKGNAAVSAKDYEGAVSMYGEALKLSSDGPNSHVYYSNRAAAYCHMNRYEDAVNDCQSCLALSPDYVKAYSRMGLAYFFLEKFQESVDAYERAAELEPDNKQTQDSLRQAKNKLKKTKQQSVAAPAAAAAQSSGDAPGGLPSLDKLMHNPSMKKALDQVGGPSGLANLMKDPQMMAMAQQMMKDPVMMQQAMSMLGGGAGGAGGGGGMPDMSALAGLMGGLGGAGAADSNEVPSSSSAPSSSSSSKNAKKPFKGFED